ncbi:MAG TPA: DUF202 domain-containing protein [Nitrospirae bacterium]|nr:DUF202 domain-containing protein [Nitrospirota bacterium]HDZ02327.1 DUF202 domain-containing protein [Nitrospirota bacterium]
MKDNLNSRNTHDNPVLRDHLAAQRTMLANERTYLAYIRTSLTLFVAGVSFIKFFGNMVYAIIGWLLIPLGILVLIKGIISYVKMKQVIAEEDHL